MVNTICLNMIVKDEAKVIERCLESVLVAVPNLACWAITDTGSTDGTQQIVKDFFENHAIPGLLTEVPFSNFGRSRSQAMDKAKLEMEFSHLLFVDADMELKGHLPLEAPGAMQFHQRHPSDDLSYWNTRLASTDAALRYVGATHEYLDLADGTESQKCHTLKVIDHGDGGSKSNKLQRDLDLLLAEIQLDPGSSRDRFYLAQTFKDLGLNAKALEHYLIRAQSGGYEEEEWYARWQAGRCQMNLGELDAAEYELREAYELRPSRAEPLGDLAWIYGHWGKHELAMQTIETGLAIPYPESDSLFIHGQCYHEVLYRQAAISGYYSRLQRRKNDGERSALWLSTDRGTGEETRRVSRQTLPWYTRSLSEVLDTDVDFTSLGDGFNPSVTHMPSGLAYSLRTANYKIVDGKYVIDNRDSSISTQNYIIDPDGTQRLIAQNESDGHHPKATVKGLEDIRLLWAGGQLWASATRVDLKDSLDVPRMILVRLEPGCRFTDSSVDGYSVAHQVVLTGIGDDLCQKNWLLFQSDEQAHSEDPVSKIRMLYSSDPAIVLEVDVETGVCTVVSSTQPPLALDHLRGGSQVIHWGPTGDHWLYVSHEVSYIGDHRQYLHRFVELNEDYRVVGASRPFHFRERGIEFCAGMIQDGGDLVITFGVNDEQAWSARVSIFKVEAAITACPEVDD